MDKPTWLEQAARVAYHGYDRETGELLIDDTERRQAGWDPLEDDGDAFRLLMAVPLSLEQSSNRVVDLVAPDGRCLPARADDPADIRRAIVEAAIHHADRSLETVCLTPLPHFPRYESLQHGRPDYSDRQIHLLERLIVSLKSFLQDSVHNLSHQCSIVRLDIASQILDTLSALNHSPESENLHKNLQDSLINLEENLFAPMVDDAQQTTLRIPESKCRYIGFLHNYVVGCYEAIATKASASEEGTP